MNSKNPNQNSDRARKLFIRATLVTSSTIATLIGAQNLALLDRQQFQSIEQDTSVTFNAPILPIESLLPTSTPIAFQSVAPTPTELSIQISAPSITILRRNGQLTQSVVTDQTNLVASNTSIGIQPPVPSQAIVSSQVAIQPPVPSTLPDPDPIIIQQSAPSVEQPQQVQQETIIVQQQPAPQTTRSSR